MEQKETFDSWAIIDLFGHSRIAGRVTEATIGGCSFIRVDVPEVNGKPAFTRFYGNGAIYSMSPVSEEIARAAATHFRPVPIQSYEMPMQPQLTAGDEAEAFRIVSAKLPKGDREWLAQKMDEADMQRESVENQPDEGEDEGYVEDPYAEDEEDL